MIFERFLESKSENFWKISEIFWKIPDPWAKIAKMAIFVIFKILQFWKLQNFEKFSR